MYFPHCNVCRDKELTQYLTICENCIPKWISVKTKLPSIGKKVLIYFDGHAETGLYSKHLGWCTKEHKHDVPVTHWMNITLPDT